MSASTNNNLRVLVAIASYGTANQPYLSQLIHEYRAMSYATDIVVCCEAERNYGPGVEVRVGLPSKNPFSLPFAHKQLFYERMNDYDLFIYAEDDMLVTQRNVESFLRVSEALEDDEVAGFLRFERDPEGKMSYPDVHLNYHWEPSSVRSRANFTLAFFTNEHAACYMLTRPQLERAIKSGGFLVAPYEGEYQMREAAATDPYTRCGLTKLICISHIDDFLLHHMPNKYIGQLGIGAADFDCQIQALRRIAAERKAPSSLLNGKSVVKAAHFGKNYYEPAREELVKLIPAGAKTVLSLGCGWGATEEKLVREGKRVVAIGLDPVISACAQARGVETIEEDRLAASETVSGQKFDCLLISNLLHLIPQPGEVLSRFARVLSEDATVIVAVPNAFSGAVLWKKLRRMESHKFLGDFEKSGVHLTSRRAVRQWLGEAGLKLERFVDVLQQRENKGRPVFESLLPFMTSEIVAIAAPM